MDYQVFGDIDPVHAYAGDVVVDVVYKRKTALEGRGEPSQVQLRVHL